MSFRYQLDRTSKKFLCPACERRRFVRYVDEHKDVYLPERYGRCDREVNCSYHLNPYKDGYKPDDGWLCESGRGVTVSQTVKRPKPKIPSSYIQKNVMEASLCRYDQNHFVNFLVSKFGKIKAMQLVREYRVGTAKHWYGSTVFWQIDIQENIRSGKIMLYDKLSGKRIKIPFPHITWVHKVLKIPDYNLNQCLFGEHLLSSNTMQVALVESEKSAIVAKAYYPQLIWLGTGSLSNLSEKNLLSLKDREVFLFPDLGAYSDWCQKAKRFTGIAKFTVSDLLERHARPEDHKQGLDLADYLLMFEWKAGKYC